MEDCKKKKCKLWLEQAAVNLDKFKKNVQKTVKKLEKSNPRDEKRIKVFKKMIANFDNAAQKKKNIKIEMDICSRYYCNPACKNTIFEDGPANELSNGMKKKYKSDLTRKFWLDQRKELFGKEKSVLKDNFYNKLSAKTLKNLKKEGAISGCVKK